MTIIKRNELILAPSFEPKTKRHYVNGWLSVVHCHHYSTLYSQLALDAKETGLLVETAEDTFYEIFTDYFAKHPLPSLTEKIDIACQYFGALGLGKMRVNHLGDNSGEVELLTSHLDQGWLMKWGTHDTPVNYMSCGYIAALFSAVLGERTRIFSVQEIQSIVMGAKTSLFSIVRR